MILSVLQENLLKALSRTGRIISSKPQLPIVQNALLVAEEGRLRISTTNLETTETVWVGAKVERDGGICVSSRLLTELVMSFPQETVSLTVHEGGLRVRCASFTATLPGIAASEFPPISLANKKGLSPVDKRQFIESLMQVIFAAATDEGRPLLTGVKIQKKDEGSLLAATDGYRLSVKTAPLAIKDAPEMVVPARAFAELTKVSQEEKETERLSLGISSEGQLTMVVGDTEITTRLISGEYPNFEKIIPAKHTTRALVDKEKITRAVKSAAIFARDSANIVKLRVENQKITVSANTPQVGENSVEVEAKIDGDGGEIAFNSRFLLEFLANFPEEELLFEMTGALNPGVFKPVKDDSYLHIVMPVRMQG